MLRPLYNITTDYQRLLELASLTDDPDDLQAFSDTLAGLDGELDNKLLSCAAVVKMLDAEQIGIDAEYKRLGTRSDVIANARIRLKAYMQDAMEKAGKDKVKGDLFTVALQNNPARAVIDDDKRIPVKFIRTKTEIATGDIRDALKAGEEVPGAHLEQSKGLRIR